MMKHKALALITLALLSSAPLHAGSYIGGNLIADVKIKDSNLIFVGGTTVSASGVKVDGELVIGNSIRQSEIHGNVIAAIDIQDTTMVAVGYGRIIIGNAVD